jgi:hypothetical protein
MAEKHIECKKIHYKSDFKIVERPKDETLGSVPFRYTYFARSAVEASWDGQTFSNCKRNPDGSITIIFNAERLGLGPLKVKREYFIPDSDFEDGICHKVYVENTGIDLVSSASSPVVVEMEVVPPYIYLQEIVDALTDTSPTKALSANQGRVLSERIVTVREAMTTSLIQETTQRTAADTALSKQLAATAETLEHLKNRDTALDEMITAVMMQMTYAKDIGLFKTSAQAEDAAITWAGAPGIRFIFYATEEGQIGTIRQVYSSEGYTLQFLDRDGAQYVRIVYYDGYLKSAWRPIDRASIVYKLMYTASSRRLEFHDPIHDEGFGGITLPEATTTQSGLMSAEQVQNLDGAVKTTGAQAIAGIKTFNDNLVIAGKSTIAKNIDRGELKVLHQGSSKGFIIRTRNTTDALLPLEMLTTDGYQSYTYAFPAKGGTVALTDDVAAVVASAIAQVVAEAPEDLNTLKEVADYIAADKTGAAKIETSLSALDSFTQYQAEVTMNHQTMINDLYSWKRDYDDRLPSWNRAMQDVANLKDSLVFDKDLGTVNTSGTAENSAIALASEADVLQIRYKTSNGQVGTIRQVYSNNGNTLQFLTLNGTEFVRTVNYNSGTKSAWRNIDRASLVYKLMYTAGSRRLEFHDPIQDTGFGGITLPEATSEASGLMTAEQVQRLDRLQQFLTKLETALGTTDLDTIVSHLAQ